MVLEYTQVRADTVHMDSWTHTYMYTNVTAAHLAGPLVQSYCKFTSMWNLWTTNEAGAYSFKARKKNF